MQRHLTPNPFRFRGFWGHTSGTISLSTKTRFVVCLFLHLCVRILSQNESLIVLFEEPKSASRPTWRARSFSAFGKEIIFQADRFTTHLHFSNCLMTERAPLEFNLTLAFPLRDSIKRMHFKGIHALHLRLISTFYFITSLFLGKTK